MTVIITEKLGLIMYEGLLLNNKITCQEIRANKPNWFYTKHFKYEKVEGNQYKIRTKIGVKVEALKQYVETLKVNYDKDIQVQSW